MARPTCSRMACRLHQCATPFPPTREASGLLRDKCRPARPIHRYFREKDRPAHHITPILGHFSCAGRAFLRASAPGQAGRTFSRLQPTCPTTGPRHRQYVEGRKTVWHGRAKMRINDALMRIGYEDADNLSAWQQPIHVCGRRRHRWTILEGNALGSAALH